MSVLIGSITFILGLLLDLSYLKSFFFSFAFCLQMTTLKVLTKSPLSLGEGSEELSIKCQDPLSSQKLTHLDAGSSASVDLLENHSNTSMIPS